MKKVIVLVSLMMVMACGCFSSLVRYEFLEASHEGNYKRIFGDANLDDIKITNSVVIDYKFRPWTMFVVTTDDWEFEIIAPQSWIDERIKKSYLREATLPFLINRARIRKENPIRKWYAPKPFESYKPYYEYMTSIAYVHMLVDKEKINDNLYRVFISKH